MTGSDNRGTKSGDEPTIDQDSRWRQATQRLYEPERDGELTTAIVFAIADAANVSPSELKSPTLYEVIEVTGLEKTFFGCGTETSDRNTTGSVEFRYTKYRVKVRSDGWIQVYEPTEPEQM